MTDADESAPEAQRPRLRVISGNPTPEELAALVAVVAAASSDEEPPAEPVNPWSAPSGMHRQPLPAPSPYAWSHPLG